MKYIFATQIFTLKGFDTIFFKIKVIQIYNSFANKMFIKDWFFVYLDIPIISDYLITYQRLGGVFFTKFGPPLKQFLIELIIYLIITNIIITSEEEKFSNMM